MNRAEILDNAKELIYGQRQEDYGSPQDNFKRIADMWSVILEKEVTEAQVALCMASLKMARLVNTPNHLDSYVDAAGYIALAGELANDD